MYKFFDKYSTKVDQIEAVVREVPYIGSVFRLLKHAMHAKGWQEETNLELQCENIERIAADTTSFNQCSNALAYHLVRKYREYIVLPHKFNHTLWDNLTRQFHCSKVLHLGKEQYKHHFTQELACVQEIAMIHASIVMVAAACNQLLFTATQVKHIYQLYASGDIQQADLELHDLIHTIDTVETVLKQETKFTL